MALYFFSLCNMNYSLGEDDLQRNMTLITAGGEFWKKMKHSKNRKPMKFELKRSFSTSLGELSQEPADSYYDI